MLLQFPLVPVYSDCPDLRSARIRPQYGRLELEKSGGVGASTTLSSTKIKPQSTHCSGIISNGQLNITPVIDIMQMRPSFVSLRPQEEATDAFSDDEGDEEGSSAPIQQVHMRRKESDRAESSRMQSFSYIQSQEEAESWKTLDVYLPGNASIIQQENVLINYFYFRLRKIRHHCTQTNK